MSSALIQRRLGRRQISLILYQCNTIHELFYFTFLYEKNSLSLCNDNTNFGFLNVIRLGYTEELVLYTIGTNIGKLVLSSNHVSL